MNTENVYHTTSLIFAAWLVSTRRLKFQGCEEPKGNSRICSFLFEDPNQEGDDLYAEFLLGPCNSFYESVKTLRKMIDSKRPSYYGMSGVRNR